MYQLLHFLIIKFSNYESSLTYLVKQYSKRKYRIRNNSTKTKELVLIERSGKKYNKLSKGVWWMPRLSEAKKDVISCEKLRGEAHIL